MDFISFARCHGVEISRLEQGDRIYRCPTAKHPNSTNGAYYFDGRRGWVQSWESSDGPQWWNDDTVPAWSAQEKQAWAARRANEVAAKAKLNAAASRKAAEAIKAAQLKEHPYLVEKGFPESKALVSEAGELLIPMRDISGALLGVQVIKVSADRLRWEKKMIYGMRAKGAVCLMGPKSATEICLVEGYATALSVDAALRLLRLNASVLVCFSAQNLVYVAQNGSGHRYIYADNDLSQTGHKAALDAGLPFCMSDVVGHDANDDHLKFGVMAVAKKIMEVRKI